MKRFVRFCFALLMALGFFSLTFGQVAINHDGADPDSSAILDVQSTSAGILIPRMSSAQRDSIIAPIKGLLIFNNETNSFWFHNGTLWTELGAASPTGNAIFVYDNVDSVVKVDTNQIGNIEFDDFLFGSFQLDSTIDTMYHNRFLFDKSQGAFRAGGAAGDQWDEYKRGKHSFAAGYDVTASGDYSMTLGEKSRATGLNAIALGKKAYAYGDNSLAWGNRSQALEVGAIALGSEAFAREKNSIAVGYEVDASNYGSVALGQYSQSSGQGSVAAGDNVVASNDGAIALGSNVNATGFTSIAVGYQALSSGSSSVALGSNVNATADEAISLGFGNQAQGQQSMAVGFNSYTEAQGGFALGTDNFSLANASFTVGSGLIAPSINEHVIGNFNDIYIPITDSTWNPTDRVFTVANGKDASNRSNALTILKNGHTGIGTYQPDTTLHVVGGFRFEDGNQANGRVLTSDVNGHASWQAPAPASDDQNLTGASLTGDTLQIDIENGSSTSVVLSGLNKSIFIYDPVRNLVLVDTLKTDSIAIDDFVFGSFQLDSTIDSLYHNRFLFDKSQGAFRAGGAAGDQWDEYKRGMHSFAAGYDVTASGDYSMTLGEKSRATGLNAIALGKKAYAYGDYSLAWGNRSQALEVGAIALGTEAFARNENSIAVGFEVDASNYGSVALGQYAQSSGQGSVAAGDNVIASNDGAIALGSNVNATGFTSIALGYQALSSGGSSVAFGSNVNATADEAIALGFNNNAQAYQSMAIGFGTYTESPGAFALGSNNFSLARSSYSLGTGLVSASINEHVVGNYNDIYIPITDSTWNPTDRIFTVGNGENSVSRSNALTILKNGHTGLGTTTPQATLDVDGTLRYTDGNQALGKILTSDANGNASWEIPAPSSDDQNLTGAALTGTNLQIDIENGTSVNVDLSALVDDADADASNEIQVLSISNDTLFLSLSDDTIALPVASFISDADNDTKIQVEESTDEDIIRFDIAGTQQWQMVGPRFEPNNSGFSIFLGEEAGLNDDLSNNHNIFVGYRSGLNNATGANNLFLGNEAGRNNTGGSNNIGLGFQALYQSDVSSGNMALGFQSQFGRTSGSGNISIGSNSLRNNISGSNNIALGAGALRDNTGTDNIAIGAQAGFSNTGSGNVFLGRAAGQNATGDNTLYIDNSNTSDPLIYGEFDSDFLRVNGTLNVNNAYDLPTSDGSNGYVMTTDGSGTASWTDPGSDLQTISLSGDTVSLSDGGGSFVLPTSTLISDADNDTKIEVEANNDEDIIRMSTAGNERLTIANSGLVGIGTTSPTAGLEISGSDTTTNGTYAALRIRNTSASNSLWNLRVGGTGTNTPAGGLSFANPNGYHMVFKSNGDLGVGTNNAEAAFHVVRSSSGDANGIKLTQGAANSLFYHNSNNDLVIRKQSETNQLVLDNGGNVGIGTDAPNAQLQVLDNVNGVGVFVTTIQNTANSSNSNGLRIQAGQNSQTVNNRLISFVRPDGTEIGAVRQTSSAGVDYWSPSDFRLKTNIQNSSLGLSELMRLEVKDYVFKDDKDNPQTGFIAQDVFKIFPNAVSVGGDNPMTDPWMMNYGKLTPLLVKAIQEQQAEIEALEEKLDQVAYLESRLAELEAIIESLK